MRAAQLGDGIVAIADQHSLEERPGFFHRRAIVAGGQLAAEQVFQRQLGIAEKLVEESPAQIFGRAAVAGKQRAGHFLRQFEPKGVVIEIGKKRR